MFETFLPGGEEIKSLSYLGVFGIWGFGFHNWICVTDSRVSLIEITPLRGVVYHEVPGDRIDQVSFHQPTYWLTIIGCIIVALLTTEFLSELFFFEDIGYKISDSMTSLLNSMTSPFFDVGDYWDEFFFAVILTIWLYSITFVTLRLSRRIIKRGVVISGPKKPLIAYVDKEFAPDASKMVREVSRMRERCISKAGIR